ncbi:MAG: tetratricopeptide repeat protein [Acidobacteria bacterium]|nr:tetratricopeptide repeat protein [Acidobacteriota bacterium]
MIEISISGLRRSGVRRSGRSRSLKLLRLALCLLAASIVQQVAPAQGQRTRGSMAESKKVAGEQERSGGSAPSPRQLQAEQYFKQAEDLVGTAEENSDRQIELFQKALELDPDLTAAEFNLGVIYTRLHAAGKALAHFNRIVEKAPATSTLGVNARYLLALNLKALGRIVEAKERLQRVLEVNAGHADALGLLAAIYLDEGNTEQAKTLLEKAVEVNPRLESAFYTLAFIAQKNGQAEEALRYYQKFTELVPKDAAAQLNMAALLAGMDRMEEATKYARRATELDPDNADTWTELGKIQSLTDSQDEAQQSFQRAVALRPQWSEAHRLLVGLLLNAGRAEEADEILQQVEKTNPREPEFYTLVGRVAVRLGDPVRSLQAYGKARQLDPTAERTFDFAMAYARSGIYPLAEEYLAEAVKMQPALCEAWLNLGSVRDRRQDAQAALEAYQRAEACGIRDGALWYRIGMLYARLQNAEQALGYLGKAIDSDPPKWKAVLREALKAVESDLDSVRYKPEFQKLIE